MPASPRRCLRPTSWHAHTVVRHTSHTLPGQHQLSIIGAAEQESPPKAGFPACAFEFVTIILYIVYFAHI